MFGKNKELPVMSTYEIRKPIPNCALCQWGHGILGKENDVVIIKTHCTAQAMISQDEVYNNDQCKELYSLDPLKHKKIIDEIEKEIPDYGKTPDLNLDDLLD